MIEFAWAELTVRSEISLFSISQSLSELAKYHDEGQHPLSTGKPKTNLAHSCRAIAKTRRQPDVSAELGAFSEDHSSPMSRQMTELWHWSSQNFADADKMCSPVQVK